MTDSAPSSNYLTNTRQYLLSFFRQDNSSSILNYSVNVSLPVFAILGTFLVVFLLRWIYTTFFPKRTFVNTSIVITGAGGAVGRQLALAFSKYAPLVLLDISKNGLDTTIGALQEQNAKDTSFNPVYVAYPCDITDPLEVHRVLTKAREQLKVPTRIVINNAGIVIGKDIDILTVNEITRVFDVNVLGAFNLIKATLPDMKQHKDGCIVSVASVMSLVGSARLSEYCMSKWGLVGVMESLRCELGRDNYYDRIDTVTVCPYHIRSSSLFAGAFEASEAYNPIRAIFYPSLTDTEVAQSILKAVLQGGHQFLVLPPSLYYVAYLSRLLLPLRYFDKFVGWFGGWHGMSTFTGTRDTTVNRSNHKLSNDQGSLSFTQSMQEPPEKKSSFFSSLPIALNDTELPSPGKPLTQQQSLFDPRKPSKDTLLSNNTVLFDNSVPMVRMSSLIQQTETKTTEPSPSSIRMRRSSHTETIPTRIMSNMIGPSGTYKARDWGLKN